MSNKFKQQAAAQRAAVPQIDLEASPARVAETDEQPAPVPGPEPAELEKAPLQSTSALPAKPAVNLTVVDTSERPVSQGFQMYPSRHRQLAKDLAYIEDRKPWAILDDALEEYVVKHYGKEHKRR